jgi:hypothetical protein
MRSKFLLVALSLIVGAITARAEEAVYAKRAFEIKDESRDLMVENTAVVFQTEQTVQANRRQPDLAFGFFAGQATFNRQIVKLGDSLTGYGEADLATVGIDVKKDLWQRNFGLGFQLEYQNTRNRTGSLHIMPATGYIFGRTREVTQIHIKGVAEVGYTQAYVRQLGTEARSGGLAASAAFWQAGFEIPLKSGREEWSAGLFYSERLSPNGEVDLSGETIKLQGAITL